MPVMEGPGTVAVRIRSGWGWLVLVTLTVSTIGDEISLITLMFRAAENETRFAVPMLLIAQLLPGPCALSGHGFTVAV